MWLCMQCNQLLYSNACGTKLLDIKGMLLIYPLIIRSFQDLVWYLNQYEHHKVYIWTWVSTLDRSPSCWTKVHNHLTHHKSPLWTWDSSLNLISSPISDINDEWNATKNIKAIIIISSSLDPQHHQYKATIVVPLWTTHLNTTQHFNQIYHDN